MLHYIVKLFEQIKHVLFSFIEKKAKIIYGYSFLNSIKIDLLKTDLLLKFLTI